jgi:L-rhamnose mutarotase
MFAILRTEKLKTAGNIGGLNAHLTRTMDVPNADQELARYNKRHIGSADLWADVQNRLKEAGITKTRKDGVLAVEHLATYSPEGFASFKKISDPKGAKLQADQSEIDRWNRFVKDTYKWLCDRYGEKNLVNFTMHMDEKTPHIHAVVVPVDPKGKLNCKHFLGGREKMRDMQDSFAQTHKQLGLERGLKGSKANHQEVKQFYTQVKEASQYRVQSPQLLPPMIALEKPETEGLINRLSFDANEYKDQQEQHLKAANQTIYQENQQRVQYSLSELSKQANAYLLLSIENKRLKEQLKGLKSEVDKLQEVVKGGKLLINALAEAKVQPLELKLAKEQLPEKGNKRQEQIHGIMKDIGCEVKQPEKKLGFDQSKGRGMGL